MPIPEFLEKFVLKEIIQTLEDKMPSWLNKSLVSHLVSLLIGVYGLLPTTIAPDLHFTVPAIPAWILSVLGAVGLYHTVQNS